MSTKSTLRAAANEEVRAQRLPEGARCAICRTDRSLVLVGPSIRCYAHRRSTVRAVEAHHLAGAANLPGLVAPYAANAHREFHDWERALGLDELPPAGGEPLLLLAHVLKGIGLLVLQLSHWLAAYLAAREQGGDGPEFPLVP